VSPEKTVSWPASAQPAAHVFVEYLGDAFDLGGPDGHHLARVLRLRPGAVVSAADGAGAWRPYEVTAVLGTGVTLEARGPSRVEPVLEPRLAVAFALTKGDKPELVVQKLTELGADRIMPVVSERSVARPDPARAEAAAVRWRRVALEAARQCRRARLPELSALAPVGVLAGHPGLVVAEPGGIEASRLGRPPHGEVLLVVGPEGGFSPAEVDGLRPWARLGLGPRILRAETAAVAAAAVLSLERVAAAADPPDGG